MLGYDAPFVNKIFEIVCDESTNDIITWSKNGESFVVLDTDEFEMKVLPLYFRDYDYTLFKDHLLRHGFHEATGSSLRERFVCPQSDELSKIKLSGDPDTIARSGDVIQILCSLTQRKYENELLLSSLYGELEATRTLITGTNSSLEFSCPGLP
mmetsp:Transcript_22088/g.28204  ORF Transcript_22088/g.28204 Transcript_22088/m.28204 type:complete len:154 (+) Transcript_22088:351-812(+)